MSVTIDQLSGNVSAETRRLNAGLFGPELPAAQPDPDADEQDEDSIQAALESWLVERGYGRRTPKRMQRHHTGRWVIHLHKAKSNPILLDVLLLRHTAGDPAGHCAAFELELKAKKGRLSPDQNSLVLRGDGAVAWSIDDAKEKVLEWEEAQNTNNKQGGTA